MAYLNIFATLVICVQAHASTHLYAVKSHLLVDGKEVSSPSVVINGNKVAEVSDGLMGNYGIAHDGMKMQVFVNEKGKVTTDEIFVKYRVIRKSEGKTFRAAKAFVVKSGEENTIDLGEDSTRNDVQLKITVTRDGVID